MVKYRVMVRVRVRLEISVITVGLTDCTAMDVYVHPS